MGKQIIKTREQLIKEQEEFHKKMARLPWAKKIKIARDMRDLGDIWKRSEQHES